MVLIGNILQRDFYLRDTLAAARELIGCNLVVLNKPVLKSDILSGGKAYIDESLLKISGKIVECEAYLGHNDKACHSYKANPKGRTNIMYNKGGYAYIYLIYGMYNCFNIVTADEGKPEAVLIRALEPLNSGEDIKRFSGPGKLCRETGITRADYGMDLCAETAASRLIILKPDNYIKPQIVSAKRIGVNYSEQAAEYPYRFYDKNSNSVSKK